MAASAQGPDQSHLAWKRMIPYLYDLLISHALPWPSLACRWGPLLESGKSKNRQRLYLSEQTDGTEPNKIVVVDVDVARPRTASADHLQNFTDHSRSPHVSRPLRTVLHPGEVNRMREVPQHPHVLVTHTDAPQLYVWNMDTQPDRAAAGKGSATPGGSSSSGGSKPSMADLVLEGHEENAEFALGVSSAAPLVASGGKDTKVLVWDLAAHITSLAAAPAAAAGGGEATLRAGARLQPLHSLAGHSATIEDVCWCPGSTSQLASVGDDSCLLLWDTRRGTSPVHRATRAHGSQDVHCVSWSPHRQELLVTGAANGTVNVWDRRKVDTPFFAFRHHSQAATVVEWSPHRAGVFASAGEDRLLCVWDLDAKTPDADAQPASKRQKSAIPPQMMFQHAGHRAPVVDFQWNPHDPWTLLSVADEAGEGGGGTLHLWRISDLVYRPDEEVVAELEPYREYIISGHEAALTRKASTATLQQHTAAAGGQGAAAAPPAATAAATADPPRAPAALPKPPSTAADSRGDADADTGGVGAVAAS